MSLPENTLIDHVNHPLALQIRALLDRSERQASQQILIDDEDNMLQALSAGVPLQHVFTTDLTGLSETLRRRLANTTPITEISARTAKKIFGGEKMSREFAIAATPTVRTLNEITASTQGDFVVLDKLSITGNVGAIIRTSLACDISALVLLDSDPVDTYDRRIIRASRGYVFSLPIIHCTTTEFLKLCRAQNITLVNTCAQAPLAVEEAVNDSTRWAIIFGSEKDGASTALTNAANKQIRLHMAPGVESLNVSAAASIVLYLRNLSRQKT